MPTQTEGAWGVNAGAEDANGAIHGVSMGIDGPGGVVDGVRGVIHLA